MDKEFDFEKCKLSEDVPEQKEQPKPAEEPEETKHEAGGIDSFFDTISNSTEKRGGDRMEENRNKDYETFGASAANFQYEKFQSHRGRGGYRGRGRGRGNRGGYNNYNRGGRGNFYGNNN